MSDRTSDVMVNSVNNQRRRIDYEWSIFYCLCDEMLLLYFSRGTFCRENFISPFAVYNS